MMNTNKIRYLRKLTRIGINGLFALGIIMSQNTFAKLQAIVNTTEIQQGYTFLLTLTSDSKVDYDQVDLKPLDKYFYVGSKSQGYNSAWINGKVSVESTLRIALAAKHAGTIVIPSFTLGKDKTAPITMTVTKNSDAMKKVDFSIDANLDKKELYPGERATYSVTIYGGESLNNAQLRPPYADNNKVTVESVKDEPPLRVVRNGKEYIKNIRHYILTSNTSGEVQINGARLQGNVQRSAGGPIIPVDLAATPLTLHLLDKPADYKGIWLPTSKLTLTDSWSGDLSNVHAGDSITREIKLTIKDYPSQRFPTLTFHYPESLRNYSDKPQYTTDGDDTVMVIKQVLIPSEAGTMTIPEYTLDWWDSSHKSAEVARLAAKTLTVLPPLGKQQPKLPSIAPVQPVIAPVQTTIVDDTHAKIEIMWTRIVAALFFIFWIITLLLYLRQRSDKGLIQKTDRSNRSAPLSSLVSAIQSGNIEQIQTLYPNWLKKHQVSEEQYKALEDYMTQMLASKYSTSPTNWDSKEFLTLVQSIEAKQSKPNQSKLATIVP